MKIIIATVLAGLISGCATNSGVVPMGPDTYMVSRQAGTGFTGAGNLKADAFREANDFCREKGKEIRVTNTSEAQPPYVMGNFPRAEVDFMCLSRGDSELTRPKMTQEPTSVIEVRKPGSN